MVIDVLLVELGLKLVELPRFGPLPDTRGLIVRLERLVDLLGVVHEIQHEGAVLLARAGAVEPREGLHGLHAREPLVHVHRVQVGLIEPGLVLLGHQQNLVLVGAEPLG